MQAKAALYGDQNSLAHYARNLDLHIAVISDLVGGDSHHASDWFSDGADRVRNSKSNDHNPIMLADWLAGMGKELDMHAHKIKADTKHQFAAFPFAAVSEQLRSQTVKNALKYFEKRGSFKNIHECWNALLSLVSNEKDKDASNRFCIFFGQDIALAAKTICAEPIQRNLFIASMCIKDFADLSYILYRYIAANVALSGAMDMDNASDRKIPVSYIFNLLTIYDSINKLGIEDTLDTISAFIKRLTNTLDELQQESASSFEGWLKNKWATIPLAVGVIVVKIAQYFFSSSNNVARNQHMSV